MFTRIKTIKSFLIIVGSYHLIVGILGSLSSELYVWVIQVAWRATVQLTPQFAFTAQILSAYIIACALVVLFIARNPSRYRSFLLIPIITISIEFLQSLTQFSKLNTFFSILPIHHAINLVISLILIIGFSLSYYYTKENNV